MAQTLESRDCLEGCFFSLSMTESLSALAKRKKIVISNVFP